MAAGYAGLIWAFVLLALPFEIKSLSSEALLALPQPVISPIKFSKLHPYALFLDKFQRSYQIRP